MYEFIESLKSDKTFLFYRGAVALYALLSAIDIEPGDEVISQSFTCPSVPYPIVRTGAKPVYVDIKANTFNLDPDKIEEKITGRTKAIIVQHTFGIPAQMDPILEIANYHNLWVFEDCCHAFGSKYRGQEVSSFGDAAFYSFGWHKPLILGIGGAAIINNPTLKTKVAKLYEEKFVTPSIKELIVLYAQYSAYMTLFTPSRFWAMKEIYRRIRDFGKSEREVKLNEKGEEEVEVIPIPRATEVSGKRIIPYQDKRLVKKLEQFEDTIKHLEWVVSQYENHLSEIGYHPLDLEPQFEPIYYKYPLLLDQETKKQIFECARSEGIELSDMFGSPLYPPDRKANWKALGYEPGTCPIAEEVSDQIVALPVHSKIRTREIEKIFNLLENFRSASKLQSPQTTYAPERS